MKKKIGLILLFLANIIILVHAVVPYHQHDLLSISHKFCTYSDDATHNCQHISIDENGENGSGNVKFNTCHLDHDYTRFTNNSRGFQLNQLEVDSDYQSDFHSVLLIFLSRNTVQFESNWSYVPFRQIPYLESLFTFQFSQSKGLRAPPFM